MTWPALSASGLVTSRRRIPESEFRADVAALRSLLA